MLTCDSFKFILSSIGPNSCIQSIGILLFIEILSLVLLQQQGFCTQGRVSTPTTTTYLLLHKVLYTDSATSLLYLQHPASPIIRANFGLDCAITYCYSTHILNTIHAKSCKPQDSQEHLQYLLFKTTGDDKVIISI